MPFWSPTPRLNLALQGGGAHGAFTWGVLDALLEDGRFELAAISGASAGALNAAELALGLVGGCAAGARQALAAFWDDVGGCLPFEWLVLGPPEAPALAPWVQAWMGWSRWLGPGDFNPMRLDPLRDVLTRHVDFARLRTPAAPRLYVSATDARSGRCRIFGNAELSADALLASACLPTLHHTVEINGVPYWDGGFSANPPLRPFFAAPGAARDTLLVLLLPLAHAGPAPATAADIRNRLLELSFGAPLVRELQDLAEATAWAARWPVPGTPGWRLARARWHLVDAYPALAHLAVSSRLIAHGPFLQHLKAAGRLEAARWLQTHGACVGQAGTVRLDALPEPSALVAPAAAAAGATLET